jgi:hypothetical protein
MIARSAFRERIIVFMKRSSIMDARAARPMTLATSYVKRASIAGSTVIVGGTKTVTGGVPSAIGMTTIMIAIVTAIARRGNHRYPFPIVNVSGRSSF